jgi:hypothetical protein
MGLHLPGAPEIFVSCAQIRVVNGGPGNPPKVSIPGYIPQDGMWQIHLPTVLFADLWYLDHSVNLDIYWPVPTNYSVSGRFSLKRSWSDVFPGLLMSS